jgi:hypothetical protein
VTAAKFKPLVLFDAEVEVGKLITNDAFMHRKIFQTELLYITELYNS